MRARYSTNWMGPINAEWIKRNGDHWCSGRIDVYGDDVPDYTELHLPTMHNEDWNTFTKWLDNLTTPEVWDLEDIVRAYEAYNPKITWFDWSMEIKDV